eukprot:NODE_77_length_23806_cov_0.393892.p4 type:complete len:276 gc:universal NODE_77_length_23806_cov_0.393892:2489-3316(+)
MLNSTRGKEIKAKKFTTFKVKNGKVEIETFDGSNSWDLPAFIMEFEMYANALGWNSGDARITDLPTNFLLCIKGHARKAVHLARIWENYTHTSQIKVTSEDGEKGLQDQVHTFKRVSYSQAKVALVDKYLTKSMYLELYRCCSTMRMKIQTVNSYERYAFEMFEALDSFDKLLKHKEELKNENTKRISVIQESLRNAFINGLPDYIKDQLTLNLPPKFKDIISMAKKIQDNIGDSKNKDQPKQYNMEKQTFRKTKEKTEKPKKIDEKPKCYYCKK